LINDASARVPRTSPAISRGNAAITTIFAFPGIAPSYEPTSIPLRQHFPQVDSIVAKVDIWLCTIVCAWQLKRLFPGRDLTAFPQHSRSPNGMHAWLRLALPALLCAGPLAPVLHAQAPQRATSQQVIIDAHAPTTPFPHFCEQVFGSGHAILALRESYRDDIRSVDDDHGNVLPKYAAMGSPVDPTTAQVLQLNQETALGPPAQTQLHDGNLTLKLTPNALLLIKVQP
jgi:hypothetical protein